MPCSLASIGSVLILCEYIQIGETCMNRRQKGIEIVKARIKKAKAKLAPQTKPKYISKAERAKLEAESAEDAAVVSES